LKSDTLISPSLMLSNMGLTAMGVVLWHQYGNLPNLMRLGNTSPFMKIIWQSSLSVGVPHLCVFLAQRASWIQTDKELNESFTEDGARKNGYMIAGVYLVASLISNLVFREEFAPYRIIDPAVGWPLGCNIFGGQVVMLLSIWGT
jgi:hypothetical protein